MEEIQKGYTRVSEVLGQWNHLAHIDPGVLANKCRIGTEVHEKILGEIEGVYVETSEDALGYVNSWNEWAMDQKTYVDILTTEHRFYSEKLKMTGCVDAIVVNDMKYYLIDYKTSAAANPKMWALQGAFYYMLAHENGFNVEKDIYFLHLDKKGKKAKERVFTFTEDLWEICLAALRTYRYFKG